MSFQGTRGAVPSAGLTFSFCVRENVSFWFMLCEIVFILCNCRISTAFLSWLLYSAIYVVSDLLASFLPSSVLTSDACFMSLLCSGCQCN